MCLRKGKKNTGHHTAKQNQFVMFSDWMDTQWIVIHTLNAKVKLFWRTQVLSLVHTLIYTIEYKRKYWNLFSVRFGPDGQMEMVSLRNLQGRAGSIVFPLSVILTMPALYHHGLRGQPQHAFLSPQGREREIAICDLPTFWALSATGEGRDKKCYLPGERKKNIWLCPYFCKVQ